MSKTTLIDCCIKKYAYREISEIYKEIGASPQGLFPEQVDGMLRRYGENSFAKRKKDTMLRCLRRAFINPFHIILFVLGMISLATDVVLASNFARNATTAISLPGSDHRRKCDSGKKLQYPQLWQYGNADTA